MRGTNHLATAAQCSSFSNGHGPFRLNNPKSCSIILIHFSILYWTYVDQVVVFTITLSTLVLKLWFKFAQILHWWYAPLFKLNLSNFFYWLLCQLTKIWQCVTTLRGLLFRQLIGTSMSFLLAVIRVLGDPINVRSTQRHFSNIHSGARGRFLWWTCQLYKAVKMIKVPFRNPERETEMEREREEELKECRAGSMQTYSQTGGDGE